MRKAKKKFHIRLTIGSQLTESNSIYLSAIAIIVMGSLVFFNGLHNPFMGDDNVQILINTPVHSLSNIKQFFEGGTFYSGQASQPLIGAYYRPLMTTAFSLLYTLFGPHQYYFHLFQLLFVIGSAIILYVLFRHFFKQSLAFALAALFLVHPINSQIAFAIPSMQDALYFFFGILGLFVLIRLKSVPGLLLASACFFLSLLAKETGLLFVIMAVVYMFWWNRDRLRSFLVLFVFPLIAYIFLRINAVGLFANPANAPIDKLGLGSRLLTAPSIMLFYVSKLLLPLHLASAYYWTYPHFSFDHFVVPLFIDVFAIAIVFGVAFWLYRYASRQQFLRFLFFAVWSAFGIGMLLQIVPIDSTASEAWFYFPMAGVLGMIGVTLHELSGLFSTKLVEYSALSILVVVIGLCGIRTYLRANEWSSPYSLANYDLRASPDDFVADYELAIQYYDQAKYKIAYKYASKSVAIFPEVMNSNVLGTDLLALYKFRAAANVEEAALSQHDNVILYDDLASLTSIIHVYGSPDADKQFLVKSLKEYPQDANIWFYLAILNYRENELVDARHDITAAYKLAPTNAVITIDYFRLLTNKTPDYTFNNSPVTY